jgi:hypothetical protein
VTICLCMCVSCAGMRSVGSTYEQDRFYLGKQRKLPDTEDGDAATMLRSAENP